MTQNSVLSQNWVKCTGCTPKGPRPRACCAQAARMLLPGRAQVARWAPCRGAQGTVSWPPSGCVTGVSCRVTVLTRCVAALCRALLPCRDTKAAPPFAIQKLYHDIKLMSHALGHVMRAAACVAAPCAISWRAISQRSAIFPFHDTKHCIATHLSSQDACARCSSLLRTGRPCRGACLSCRAWPCVPLCAYVTIQFAVS